MYMTIIIYQVRWRWNDDNNSNDDYHDDDDNDDDDMKQAGKRDMSIYAHCVRNIQISQETFYSEKHFITMKIRAETHRLKLNFGWNVLK
jgi:hypothetical protein